MRKVLLLLSLWVTLGLCAQETIKIGVVIPLSGPAAWLGEDMQDALKLQLREIEKRNTKYKYDLLFEDNQNTPRLSVDAFKKLSEVDRVDAILSFGGSPGAAISPLAANKGIIHIGLGYSPAIAVGPFNFNNCAKPESSVALMIEYLKNAGFKRVAIINQVHASTLALEKEFEAQLQDSDIQLITTQKFIPGERDFRVAILKIREAKPDIVFLHAFDPEASIIIKQMKEINFDPPISSMAHWGLAQSTELNHIPWVEMAPNNQFIKDFSNNYHRQPIYFAALMCDSLAIYIQGCESFMDTGKPNSNYIAQKMSSLREFDGVMGKTISDSDGWFSGPSHIVFRDSTGIHALTVPQAIKMVRERWPSSVAK